MVQSITPKKRIRPRPILIGKDIFVNFKNVKENPFASREGDMLIVAVCGAVQIRTNKCIPSYDAATKTATIMFHFTRPKWGERALARLVAMRVLFAGCELIEQDSVPIKAV